MLKLSLREDLSLHQVMAWFFDEYSKYKGFSPGVVTGKVSMTCMSEPSMLQTEEMSEYSTKTPVPSSIIARVPARISRARGGHRARDRVRHPRAAQGEADGEDPGPQVRS